MSKFIFLISLLLGLGSSVSAESKMPYPQQLDFAGAIKPNHVTQEEMNSSVSAYYDWWKLLYVKESNGVTKGGGYYVKYSLIYSGDQKITVSEAHGYGMIIFALMAGHDDDAKQYFDGMYNMYDKHRSTINDNLMSWVISSTEDVANDDDCATDGDMDIAYSLLLADKQWGSDGAINYLSEAKRIINDGIKKSLVDNKNRLRLGDWGTSGKYVNATRPSDWMPGHIESYRIETGDESWAAVRSEMYTMTKSLQENYSPNTGLLPDFVVNDPVEPAEPSFLEDKNDGNYNWNSCRTPWRLTTDYLHNSNADAKTSVTKMLDWLLVKTGGDVKEIYDGYTLAGGVLDSSTWNKTTAFSAPFVTAATIDAKYQDFLNDGWDLIKQNQGGSYFGNTINMLNMLLISGNWWSPTANSSSVDDVTVAIDKVDISSVYPNPFNPSVNIEFDIVTTESVNLTIYDVVGRKVKTLVNENRHKGKYVSTWNGDNGSGVKVASGVYFAKLTVSNVVRSKKLVLVK